MDLRVEVAAFGVTEAEVSKGTYLYDQLSDDALAELCRNALMRGNLWQPDVQVAQQPNGFVWFDAEDGAPERHGPFATAREAYIDAIETEGVDDPEAWGLQRVTARKVVGKQVSEADATKAPSLRSQALALLEQAQAIDGLKPFVVMHEHNFGTSIYIAWANHDLSEAEASAVLDEEFEPDRNEVLTIQEFNSLSELTGVAISARPVDILSVQEEGSDSSPSPM